MYRLVMWWGGGGVKKNDEYLMDVCGMRAVLGNSLRTKLFTHTWRVGR